jgi:FKBP-type peptidyl-prolyl cis-trans isomerase SlyD
MAIKENEVVSIEYRVVDAQTNEEVDSNIGQPALEFITGKGMIISGLENKLIELNKSDKADIVVSPEEAYGEYNQEAIQTLPKEQFAGVELAEGMVLYGTGEDGQTVQVIVKSFTDNDVTIDYNHPLAGKTLMFTVEVLDVRAATEEEIATGVIGGHAHGGSCGCGTGSCDEPEVVENTSCCGGGHCS